MRFNKKLVQSYKVLKQKSLEEFSTLHHLDSLSGPNILILSPHPDDDIFGCGGSIIRHIKQGHSINIIYLCQGDKGIKNMSGKRVAEIRKSESSEATKVLGVPSENLTYLDQKDNNLQANSFVVNSINRILEKVNPNIIYLPTFTDNHSDHYQTNLILKKCDFKKNVLIAGYEIWTPHIPNRIVDISYEMTKKSASIKEHKSQLKELDYLSAITGLNKYRASLYPKTKFEFAESFLILKKKDYLNLIE